MGQSLGIALIVDDNPLFNLVLRDMLEDIGFLVEAVTTKGEAQDALRSRAIDFLLTDLNIDEQEAGLSIAREALKHNGQMRVIVASGNPRPAELEYHFQFLQKPFTSAQLENAIRA